MPPESATINEGNSANLAKSNRSFPSRASPEGTPPWIFTSGSIPFEYNARLRVADVPATGTAATCPIAKVRSPRRFQKTHQGRSLEIQQDIDRALRRVGLEPVAHSVVMHRQIPEDGVAMRFELREESLKIDLI